MNVLITHLNNIFSFVLWTSYRKLCTLFHAYLYNISTSSAGKLARWLGEGWETNTGLPGICETPEMSIRMPQ